MSRRLLTVGALVTAVVTASGCANDGDSDADVVARAPAPAAGASADDPAGGEPAVRGVVVDVAGMVRTPGVYELPRGARVHEAITAAGGVRAGGVLDGLNRAAPVVDGQQVLVPRAGGSGAGPAVGSVGAASHAGASATVSLATADVAALDALPGIGPVTAQRIVDDRATNGPFSGVEDLDRVPGIGAGTLANLEGLVTP